MTGAVAGNIAVDSGFQKDVIAPMLVHEIFRLPGFQHIGQHRQFLEFNDDLFGEVLGLGARGGKADGDGLAHMADFSTGEDGLGRGFEARQRGDGGDGLDGGEVRAGEDQMLLAFGFGDGEDSGMRQRAAHEGQFHHAGQLQVAYEPAAATEQPVILAAGHRAADTGGR